MIAVQFAISAKQREAASRVPGEGISPHSSSSSLAATNLLTPHVPPYFRHASKNSNCTAFRKSFLDRVRSSMAPTCLPRKASRRTLDRFYPLALQCLPYFDGIINDSFTIDAGNNCGLSLAVAQGKLLCRFSRPSLESVFFEQMPQEALRVGIALLGFSPSTSYHISHGFLV